MNPVPQARDALRQYGRVATTAAVDDASPHRLVQMLLDGALERIAVARGHIDRAETAAKGEQIGRVISIVEGLRASLNRETGGEVAFNLEALYEYMERRLLEANVASDPEILDEVAGLLREIKTGWDAIAP